MQSYCLKCRKDTESINPRLSNTNVQYAGAKNQNLLEIKKQKDY